MARYLDMVADVRGAAYQAPDAVIVKALRRATQELCKSSQCWRETLDETYAESGKAAYEFAAPAETIVDKILWVKVGGVDVRKQVRPDDIQRMPESEGRPTHFAQHAVNPELLLWPTPGAKENDEPIVVHAVLSPSPRSTEFPDALMDEYGQGIVAAAKADLLMNSPEMPWHNPAMAQVQRAIADEHFARAKRAQHSGHGMLLTVVPRRFV